MRLSTFIIVSLLFSSLVFGTFVLRANAGSSPHPFQTEVVTVKECGPDNNFSHFSNTVNADALACCREGYTLVGGGASIEYEYPDIGDNLALQNSEPYDEKKGCWYARGRELHNTPWQDEYDQDDSNGEDHYSSKCDSKWSITAHAICVVLPPNNDNWTDYDDKCLSKGDRCSKDSDCCSSMKCKKKKCK